MNYNRPFFESTARSAQEIAGQNDRYNLALTSEALNPGDDQLAPYAKELKTVVINAIAKEQRSTMQNLGSLDLNAYEELARDHMHLSELLSAKQTELHRLVESSELSTENQEINKMAEFAKNLAPEVTEQLEAIRESAKQELQDQIAQEIAQITQRLEDIEELYTIAGNAWPVPVIPQEAESSITVIDILPVDPIESDQPNASSKIIEKYGSTHGASALLAAILVDNPDRAFLPEDLGNIIYKDADFGGMDEANRLHSIRNRVHRLLLDDGSAANKIIKESGYRLERGWRKYRDESGRAIHKQRRIYRVVGVDVETDTDHPEIFTEEIHAIGYELPLVITREMRGLASRMKDNCPIGKDESSNIEESRIDPEANQFCVQVNKAIELLNRYGLLPENIDTKLSVGQFKNELFKRTRRSDRKKSPYLTSLTEYINKQTDPNAYITVYLILFSALQSEYFTIAKTRDDKDFRDRLETAQIQLLTWYEQHSNN